MRQTEREYAEALFSLCAQEDICEKCLADALLVRDAFSEFPEYAELLSSPAIPLSERLAVIHEAFAERIHEYVLYFLKLLCEKGRISLVCESIKEFENICKAYLGRSVAYITSAVELEGAQKTALIEKLEKTYKKKIDPVYSVDPSLMGGMIVELDGIVYDGTLRSRLRDVKEVMMDEQTRRDQ